jgi:hypothetical protein
MGVYGAVEGTKPQQDAFKQFTNTFMGEHLNQVGEKIFVDGNLVFEYYRSGHQEIITITPEGKVILDK